MPLEQRAQLLPRRVASERGDEGDFHAHAGRERRGQGGAARAGGRLDRVHDRDGRVGREPFGAAVQVTVEQCVADHEQPGHPISVSKAAQTRWMATRWSSCTVAVCGASMHTASSATSASGLGAGPVSA